MTTRFMGEGIVDDVGNPDGAIFLAPQQFLPLSNSVLTRNAAGDYSLNTGATLAAVISAALNEGVMRRIPGLLGNLAADGTNVVVGDPVVPRGIKITDITIHYLITGAALTVHTVRMDRVKFVNNIANAISVVLANAANGLQTATQANPYTTKVPVVDPQSSAGYDTSDNSGLLIEINATTQGGGAYRFYGVTLHYTYNYD